MTARSKHYTVKYHCIRALLEPEMISVLKADIFTKGLANGTFKNNIRELLMGW